MTPATRRDLWDRSDAPSHVADVVSLLVPVAEVFTIAAVRWPCRSPDDRRAIAVDGPIDIDSELACSSIAGHRASGSLQVSLSKVRRQKQRVSSPQVCAEALPMNASDQAGPMLLYRLWPHPALHC